MHRKLVIGVLSLATLTAAPAFAQQRPAVRQLGAIVAKSTDSLVAVSGVRALSDGRVLVNDIPGRRVLLYDPALKTSTVIADSTSATANAYGGRTGGLIAYRGDSTLFVDPSSSSMLVIDPSGKIARVMSVPRSQDAGILASPTAGTPGFDANGRLVYRQFPALRPPPIGANGIPTGPPVIPESTAIIRVDLATRQVDTVGFAKIPKIKMDFQINENGGIRVSSFANPLPVVDDWAVLSDGSVAFVRGTDYHVDFVNADGTKVTAAKIPFDWRRLTDEDKIAFIDSVKAARARLIASQPAPGPGGALQGFGGGGGGGVPNIVIQGGPGAVRGGAGGGPGGAPGPQQIQFIPPSELPDYQPVFFAGSSRADRDGNLWIRTIPTKALTGGPVYDVINRKGELIDRVQVPENTSIVGFGENGTVFLALVDNKVTHVEAARVK